MEQRHTPLSGYPLYERSQKTPDSRKKEEAEINYGKMGHEQGKWINDRGPYTKT